MKSLKKIMPIGDSITAGEHYGQPALEKRTGYRKELYERLIKAGKNIEFVGSQTHGVRSKDDKEWFNYYCEAYPGFKIPAITEKLKTALPEFKPDILLIHVGTNGTDWENKPDQVKKMLDMINIFSINNDCQITVLLCLIINQFKGGHRQTTQFNKKIKEMVRIRKDDKIKIKLIDMENGADLDYTDNLPNKNTSSPYEGGDMWGERYPGVAYDTYHPNDKGNRKIAVKFFDDLMNEL